MDNSESPFHPSLAAALVKLDPEDGEQIMEYFKTHALLIREKAFLQASVREQKKLLVENAKLKNDIEHLKVQLQEKQRRRTVQAPPPAHLSINLPAWLGQQLLFLQIIILPALPHMTGETDRMGGGEGRGKPRVDVSRLDLRVGRILTTRRHPLAETMSVQEVDLGEDAPRTVVSKLVWKTHLEQLQGSLAVLLCNVKACRLRGVVSQARLLRCSTPDGVIELLAPPSGSAPGDRVTFLNYPGDPDRELQSKQRIWELLQPDLQVDCRGVANYRGCRFEVKGKGLCRAPSLINCIIR
uniref:aminoacyl tRNA synthase complex-interacting multifunctional protein 1-like n=1 Tax=Monopterus albus TaxID=43700 RepID=UPI0009B44D15|nr:aminoacyl tRNA synthase complex-interacting multifunctional protein 1-like [Monopterus albus]